MLSQFALIVLFLSSYAPLFLIFVIRNTFESFWINVGFVALALLSFAALLLILHLARRLATLPVSISSVSSRDSDAMSYIVTYLLPFLGVPLNSFLNGLSFVFLLAVICVIYVNSNMVHINPLLNLIGFHIYQVEHDGGKVSTLITRRHFVPPSGKLSVHSLGDYVLLE